MAKYLIISRVTGIIKVFPVSLIVFYIFFKNIFYYSYIENKFRFVFSMT